MAERLRELIADLLVASGPVTFLDAWQVVRGARRFAELDGDLAQELVALHDAVQLTDGARQVLAEFLKGHAQRWEQQRVLGRRAIRPTDHGKTARVNPGAVLDFVMAKDPKEAAAWVVESLEGPAEVVERTPAAADEAGAPFGLRCLAPGYVTVTLTRGPDAQNKRGPARFELRVVIEQA